MLLVTHDIAEAAFFADSIALLSNGKLVQQGSLSDLVKRSAQPFVGDFISAQRRPLESLQGLFEIVERRLLPRGLRLAEVRKEDQRR